MSRAALLSLLFLLTLAPAAQAGPRVEQADRVDGDVQRLPPREGAVGHGVGGGRGSREGQQAHEEQEDREQSLHLRNVRLGGHSQGAS